MPLCIFSCTKNIFRNSYKLRSFRLGALWFCISDDRKMFFPRLDTWVQG